VFFLIVRLPSATLFCYYFTRVPIRKAIEKLLCALRALAVQKTKFKTEKYHHYRRHNMGHQNKFIIAASAFILLLFFSCSGGNMPEEKVSFPSIENVPIEKWEKLSKKKINFGHQSVGFNIMDGIADVMKERPELKLNIVETSAAACNLKQFIPNLTY
jgi:hypothetical protein